MNVLDLFEYFRTRANKNVGTHGTYRNDALDGIVNLKDGSLNIHETYKFNNV